MTVSHLSSKIFLVLDCDIIPSSICLFIWLENNYRSFILSMKIQCLQRAICV